MKTPRSLLVLAALLLLFGCGSPEPEPELAELEPITLTTGSILLGGLPGADQRSPEIIILADIPIEIYRRIEAQHDALNNYLNPASSNPTPQQPEIKPEDAATFNQQLAEVKAGFPEQRESVFIISGQERKYRSSYDQWGKYRNYVQALNAANFQRGLEHILGAMKSDHAALETQMGDPENDRDDTNRIQAEINWLATFSEYFQRFEPLVKTYDDFRFEYAQAVAANDPAAVWASYQKEHAEQLMLDIYKESIDGGYPDADGRFQVKGEGKILVRTEIDRQSVFLIPDGIGGQYLIFSDVSTRQDVPKGP